MRALVDLAYLAASVLFILTFKGLSHPRSAVRANQLGAVWNGTTSEEQFYQIERATARGKHERGPPPCILSVRGNPGAQHKIDRHHGAIIDRPQQGCRIRGQSQGCQARARWGAPAARQSRECPQPAGPRHVPRAPDTQRLPLRDAHRGRANDDVPQTPFPGL